MAVLGGAAAWPLTGRAQPAKIARIGFLGAVSATRYASRVEAFRAGLRELGYVEGKHIVIEFRWAEGHYDRLPALAAELVRLNVDVIVAHGAPGALAGAAGNINDPHRHYRGCRHALVGSRTKPFTPRRQHHRIELLQF